MTSLVVFAFVLAIGHAVDPNTCRVTSDVDVNPHTAGLGSVPGSSIAQCCEACRSPEWWAKGCRFSTLSKGACWLKANNDTVVPSPGKTSVECLSPAPPPPPPPPPPPHGVTGAWELLGPTNIGDDIDVNGEAGTLADAASPAGNPHVIYAGGQNNGASSGIVRSLDGGRSWTVASNGIFNTRVEGVHVVDDKGAHVLAAVVGALYESLDYGDHWKLIAPGLGTCNTFKNGTINGEPHVLAGCSVGVANAPTKDGTVAVGNWSVIPPGGMERGYFSLSDTKVPGANSVIGTCVSGVPWIGRIVNKTFANYTQFPNRTGCTMLALDPNDEDHFIYTTVPAPSYQTFDGGKTWGAILGGMFHAGIDRQGWIYFAAMSGAFVSWDNGQNFSTYYGVRVQRRTNKTVTRAPHDYQRIALDFAGTVAFPSDQGLFVKPPGTELKLVSANGNLSNNIAMKVAVSAGDGVGKRYLVTTAWDWGPLASWDSGVHWPSWQSGGGVDDGGSAACIGEGGGAYAMGMSNHALVMHKHNVMYSSHGGKNLSRFIIPHGATVFGPTYAKVAGSRSEPNGAVYSPLFMGPLPWDQVADKQVACEGETMKADLGVQTNYSCLSAVDLGTQFGWYPGVNYASWNRQGDGHCQICALPGNASEWKYIDAPGAWSFALQSSRAERARRRLLKTFDADRDGRIDPHDLRATQDIEPDDDDEDRTQPRAPDEDDEDDGGGDGSGGGNDDDDDDDGDDDGDDDDDDDNDDDDDAPTNGPNFLIKNFQFGSGWNWTYQLLPPHLQDKGQVGKFVTSPADGGKSVWAIAPNCVSRSDDHGDTWGECWAFGEGALANFSGTFCGLEIKDESTMLLMRCSGGVPLRTKDGGASWHELSSVALIAPALRTLLYSWTARTLALVGSGGVQSTDHPHAGYVWMSKDDGDTWTDETADLVTMAGGAGQWFDGGQFFLNAGGQGILAKVFE